ncbi:MAG: glutamate 5-kinase [Alphaproteobacteria bacterium]|nr:glutamate 5-kinase [Alphaproteobacteria bacterium]
MTTPQITATKGQTQLLERIAATRRFMAKIGSNKIACTEKNIVHHNWVRKFISNLNTLDREFSLTSSGAIALERVLGNRPAPKTTAEKQAYAAFGQIKLMGLYQQASIPHGIAPAQVLVTKKSLSTTEGFANIQGTMKTIRALGGMVVANENDTVATEEIRFGDNDTLSAFAAAADGADTLILITDVDGFYTSNPKKNPDAKHLPIIEHVDTNIILAATGPIGDHSRGGMETKLEAARIAAGYGIDTFIIDGTSPDCITDFFNGKTKCSLIKSTAFGEYLGDERKLIDIVMANAQKTMIPS